MKNVKTVTLRELVGDLQDTCLQAGTFKECLDERYLLHDQIWVREAEGLVYRPVGEIYLPLIARFDDVSLEGKYNLGLLSVFNEHFFKNCSLPYVECYAEDQGIFSHLIGALQGKHVTNHMGGPKGVATLQVGDLNESARSYDPAMLVSEGLLPTFFGMYNQARSMNTESSRVIRKCYADFLVREE
ncbi:MAG: hypothetical protein ABIE22_02420 [archaeon]